MAALARQIFHAFAALIERAEKQPGASSRFRFPSGRALVLSALLLAASHGGAAAQNVVEIDFENQCTYTGKLCRDGNSCGDPAVDQLAPTNASASPQDVLRFINVPASGITISWSITNPDTVIEGENQQDPATGTPPADGADGTPFSVPLNTTLPTFSTGPRVPNNQGVYQTKIGIDGPDNQAGFDYALIQYTVSCVGAPPEGNRLTIIKNAIGGDDTFSIDVTNGTPSNVSLTTIGGFASQALDNLDTGAYTITETPPDGWTLESISCEHVSGGGSALGDTVTLDENTIATCTVTNRLERDRDRGTIIVKKVTIGGNDQFDFELDGPGTNETFQLTNGGQRSFSSLPTGSYSIGETNLPQGWNLKDISCDDPANESGNSVTVTLDANETITCTFTNEDKVDERMEEEIKRFINRRVDNLLTYGPNNRVLNRLQEEVPSLKDAPLKYAGDQPAMSPWRNEGTIARGYGNSLYNNARPLQEGPLWPQGIPGPEQQDTLLGTHGQPISSGNSVVSSLAAQFVPLAQSQTAFKFSTSLSELRAAATEAEAREQQKKLQDAGLSFVGNPYTVPYVTMRPGLDVWIEGHMVGYNDDLGGINRDGDFGIIYAGADYVLTPGVLIGALVQVDETNEDLDDPQTRGEIEGTGWMAGPYIGVRLYNNLYFDARAAWGTSENDIWLSDDASGKRRGDFDTDRWLASARLTGNQYYGRWRFSPQVQIAYGNESSDRFTNSIDQLVSGQDATIGRLTGTAEVGYRMATASGTIIEPYASLAGIWNFDTEDDFFINGVAFGIDESRGKIEGGVKFSTPRGWAFRAAGAYDGIGADDFEAVSGSLWLNVPLN